MVASAFSEASGNTWSRISPRGECAPECFGASTTGGVSERKEAGSGDTEAEEEAEGDSGGADEMALATCDPTATSEDSGTAEEESRLALSKACWRAGESFGSARLTLAALGTDAEGGSEAEVEGFARWPRILGNTTIVPSTKRAAANGMT